MCIVHDPTNGSVNITEYKLLDFYILQFQDEVYE